MSSGGGGGDTTTVQKADPWEGLQPYLKDLYAQAQNQYQNYAPQYFQGSTVAPVSPWTAQGAENMAAFGGSGYNQALLAGNLNAASTFANMQDPRANMALQAGQQLTPGAIDTLQKITSGSGVQVANPYLDDVVSRAQRSMAQSFNENTLPMISLNSVGGGAYGGSRQGIAEGLSADRLQQNMGDVASNMYNTAYESAQGRALQAAGMGLDQLNFGTGTALQGAQGAAAYAPSMQAMGNYGNALQLQAGDIDRRYNQQVLDDEVARWNFYQNLPAQQLAQYSAILAGQGNPGGTQTTTQQAPGKSPFAGAAGGALSGAAAGSTFGPWGTAIGAIGGGLLGYFG